MEKIQYDKNQLMLLETLEREVQRANAVAIIGSSLRDPAITSILSTAKSTCQVLVACGSKSSELCDRHLGKRANVTVVKNHFPNAQVKEWFTLQIALKGRPPEQ